MVVNLESRLEYGVLYSENKLEGYGRITQKRSYTNLGHDLTDYSMAKGEHG